MRTISIKKNGRVVNMLDLEPVVSIGWNWEHTRGQIIVTVVQHGKLIELATNFNNKENMLEQYEAAIVRFRSYKEDQDG